MLGVYASVHESNLLHNGRRWSSMGGINGIFDNTSSNTSINRPDDQQERLTKTPIILDRCFQRNYISD